MRWPVRSTVVPAAGGATSPLLRLSARSAVAAPVGIPAADVGDAAALDGDPAVVGDAGRPRDPGAGQHGAPGVRGPSRGLLLCHQAVTSVERRSQASSPAPRHPAASPRAAGTIEGSCWNVTRSGGPLPAAARRACHPPRRVRRR